MSEKFIKNNLPDNHAFGYFFSLIFLGLGIYFFVNTMLVASGLSTLLAVILIGVARFKPDLLLPLNRRWMSLGYLLGKVISPIVMAVIYFGLLAPMGLVMKVFGRDELRLRIKARQTHWRTKQVVGVGDNSFNNQF